ncbi:MAG TPA: hypothetical protein VJ724_00950 [Tahibacter sp.]|nr:hypothetical protein [Tahibacter sp.]
MRKSLFVSALAAALLVFGGVASAQTCASPIPLPSSLTVTGDTCTATNSLSSYGSITSEQNEIVYSFIAGPDILPYSTILLAVMGGFAGSSLNAFLLPTCNASTDPTDVGTPGVPMTLQDAGLVQGQTYFIVVTADPTSLAASCGQFSMSAPGYLPVGLQEFSID